MKIIIEPSCAVTLAVLLKNKEKFKNKNVALILTGGNADIVDTFNKYFIHLPKLWIFIYFKNYL